jgi:hypothetical protein
MCILLWHVLVTRYQATIPSEFFGVEPDLSSLFYNVRLW